MKEVLKTHITYLGTYVVFILSLLSIIIGYSKEETHRFINSFHNPAADIFFSTITYLGDGLSIFILALLLFFIHKKAALLVLVSGSLTGVFSQFLKKVVFGPIQRPSAFFKELSPPLHYIEWVDLHSTFSFPSGHSAVAFALATSLILSTNNKRFDLLLLIIAFGVAFSRVYLSQHFLEDIVAGSVIGVTVTIVVYTTMTRYSIYKRFFGK